MTSSILLGPLTTVFVPQSSCFSPVLNSPFPTGPKSFRLLGAEAGTQCYPPVAAISSYFFTPADKYLSPARCPSAYTPNRVDPQTSGLHSYVCCPSALSYYSARSTSVNNPSVASSISNRGYGTCRGIITGPLDYFIYDTNGYTSPFSGANPRVTTTYSIEAITIQIQFADKDISLFKFSPSEYSEYDIATTGAFGTSVATATTSGSSASSSGSSSSNGLAIGLGVGLSLAAIFIIAGVILFIVKRRKHRASKTAEANPIAHHGGSSYPTQNAQAAKAELPGVSVSQSREYPGKAELPGVSSPQEHKAVDKAELPAIQSPQELDGRPWSHRP